MKNSLLTFFIPLCLFATNLQAAPFITVGLGAGGETTTGDTAFNSAGPAMNLGAGWEASIFQIKGEFGYYLYTDTVRYNAAHSRDFGSALLLDALVGIRPLSFIALSGGYGLVAITDEQNWNQAGVNYQEQKSIGGGAWIVGAELYLFSTERMNFGFQGRYFSFSAANYQDATNVAGTKTTTTTNANTNNWGWLGVGVVRVNFK
jgi:hypothetical protein